MRNRCLVPPCSGAVVPPLSESRANQNSG